METVLAPCLHDLLDLALHSGDDHLHALQGCGLGGDGPSYGGPFLSLERRRRVFVQETESTHVRQRILDAARAVVGARAAVGLLSAARAVAARAAAARDVAARAAAARAAAAGAIIDATIAAATGADEARTAESGHSGGCEAGG
jgi:hypothetical protein